MMNARISAPWTVGVTSDLVIVGQDPEMADMSNPRGDIIAPQWYVQAEAKDGRRKVLTGVTFDDPDEAGFFANLYTGWDPEVADESVWVESRPMYGSSAWINSDAEAEQVAWENEMERW